jgi:spoIIIJ-associated protein
VYDVKNELHEFVAAGREEAIEKACRFFELTAEELSIAGFEPGAVYGLAARTVIVAAPKSRKRTEPRQRSDGPGRDRDEDNRGGNDRGGNRRESRGRERGRDRQSGNGRDEGRSERARTPRRERSREPERSETEISSEPSVGTAGGEIGEIGDFVLGVIERMDLGPFEIAESEEDELIALEVKGPAARALAQGEGRTVDALQLLANQVAARTGPERQRVVIDIEGNADAREEFLSKLAERVAKRALQTGRPVALDPMNGRDRRMIHIALRDREDVATTSEGEGRYRQVVVVPEGADGFEEAQKQSEGIGES